MDLLLIFVKDPVPGQVKTRLAKSLGDTQALSIYRQLLAHTLKVVQETDVDKVVFYGNRVPEEDLWQKASFPRQLQKGEGLGERMEQAFRWGFSQGYQRILIIGSDCLELNSAILEQGFEALQEHDAVLGPANDGGYYLLGMKTPIYALFHNKSWSTDTVLQQSINDLLKEQKSFFLLPELIDIDTEQDLRDSLASGIN
jgi:rSAM/selenodomain-associated transferase 1